MNSSMELITPRWFDKSRELHQNQQMKQDDPYETEEKGIQIPSIRNKQASRLDHSKSIQNLDQRRSSTGNLNQNHNNSFDNDENYCFK